MATVTFQNFKLMMADKGHSDDALADAFRAFDAEQTGAIATSDLHGVIESLPHRSEQDAATEDAKRVSPSYND